MDKLAPLDLADIYKILSHDEDSVFRQNENEIKNLLQKSTIAIDLTATKAADSYKEVLRILKEGKNTSINDLQGVAKNCRDRIDKLERIKKKLNDYYWES